MTTTSSAVTEPTNVVAMPHPKAAEAARQASIKRAKKEHEKEVIAKAKAAHGVRFTHIGRYTIAYRIDKRSVMEISTALLHPTDKHDKHFGEVCALSRFMANNRVLVRVGPQLTPKQQLEYMFEEI
jgi:hypothetical protein